MKSWILVYLLLAGIVLAGCSTDNPLLDKKVGSSDRSAKLTVSGTPAGGLGSNRVLLGTREEIISKLDSVRDAQKRRELREQVAEAEAAVSIPEVEVQDNILLEVVSFEIWNPDKVGLRVNGKLQFQDNQGFGNNKSVLVWAVSSDRQTEVQTQRAITFRSLNGATGDSVFIAVVNIKHSLPNNNTSEGVSWELFVLMTDSFGAQVTRSANFTQLAHSIRPVESDNSVAVDSPDSTIVVQSELIVSVNPEFQDQTLVSDRFFQRIGSVVIEAGVDNDSLIFVEQAVLSLPAEAAESISRLVLVLNRNGNKISGEIESPSTINVFPVNFSFYGFFVGTFDWYADVNENPIPGSWQASTQFRGTTNDTAIVSDEVLLQTMTIAEPGELSLDDGNHPESQYLFLGTTDNHVAQFKLTANENESWIADQFRFEVEPDLAQSINYVRVRYLNIFGQTITAQHPFMYNEGDDFAFVWFDCEFVYIEAGGNALIDVFLDINEDNASTQGRIYFRHDVDFRAAGLLSNTIISTTGERDLFGNVMTISASNQ